MIIGEENFLQADFIAGTVIPVYKDYGMTSFAVVKKIRYLLCRKLKIKKLKVGHAGTLDPLASGLLIICTGKATKTIDTFQGLQKEYHALIRLGATTPSFDLETEIDQTLPIDNISLADIERVNQKFQGEIMQTAPSFSAKHIDGKRAYEYARKGKDPEIKPSLVNLIENEIESYVPPDLKLKIVCSKGTYIRSLANDIGKELGCGAHLAGLERVKIGDFSVEKSISLESFEKMLQNM